MKTITKFFSFASMLFFAVLFTACDKKEQDIPERREIPLTKSQQIITAHINDFSFRFFDKICRHPGIAQDKVFVSPFSCDIVMSMVENGAVGETREQIHNGLCHPTDNLDELNEYFRLLTSALLQVDPSTELSIANSLWTHKEYPLKASFVNKVSEAYNARVSEVDFASPQTVDLINDWVSGKTKGLIQKLLSQLSSQTRAVMVNALYFKGIWSYRFDRSATTEELFYPANGEAIPVPMMARIGNYAYTCRDGFEAVELPYGNKAFSMIVVLPRSGKTPQDLAASLSGAAWEEAVNSMAVTEIALRLPRFTIETERMDLIPVLKQLGVTIPFTESADFGDMSDETLFISDLVQKAKIIVNEEGTEAAAATAAVVAVTALPGGPPPFCVNRPFLFMLREKSTGLLLFMGKVSQL